MRLDDYEVEGAWRSLCSTMLLQSVQTLEAASKLYRCTRACVSGSSRAKKANARRDVHNSRRRVVATEWFAGGVGTITYEDCCEASGLNPEVMRHRIEDWCKQRKRTPCSGLKRKRPVLREQDRYYKRVQWQPS